MSLAIIAFIAGILTILAPCILPVIPIIVGGSAVDSHGSKRRTLLIVASLAASILLFTLLLKASTALLGVPQSVWQVLSGGLIILLGVAYLFPQIWDTISIRTGLALGSQQQLSEAKTSAVLTGAALGPVFASCSPTYAFIVAAILPASFGEGLLYLVLYILGLTLALLGVALAGQVLIKRLGWAINPHGLFRQIVGILFILVGVLVIIGGDKAIQQAVIDSGAYDSIESLENSLRN